MHPVEQRLVVHQADEEHQRQAAGNPIELLNVGAGEFGVQSRAVDLGDANEANEKYEGQQNPIEIAE